MGRCLLVPTRHEAVPPYRLDPVSISFPKHDLLIGILPPSGLRRWRQRSFPCIALVGWSTTVFHRTLSGMWLGIGIGAGHAIGSGQGARRQAALRDRLRFAGLDAAQCAGWCAVTGRCSKPRLKSGLRDLFQRFQSFPDAALQFPERAPARSPARSAVHPLGRADRCALRQPLCRARQGSLR